MLEASNAATQYSKQVIALLGKQSSPFTVKVSWMSFLNGLTGQAGAPSMLLVLMETAGGLLLIVSCSLFFPHS